MASYQQRRVEYEVLQYSAGAGAGAGAHSWSDGYGYQNSGAYGNASGYQNSGAYGNASGYQNSGAYGNDSGYSCGGTGYGGGHLGGGACATGYDSHSGGGQARLYKAEVQTMPTMTGVYGRGSDTYQSPEGHFGGASGDPFGALVPSSFPPGTDPKFIDCFNRIDKDRSGFICDQELQSALSTFGQRFCLRTVHLLMYMFTGSNAKVVGPKEFVPLVRSLQTWKATFQRFDMDRNGRLDERELREALMSMGYNVSPLVLKLLMSKFDKSGYKCAIEYDYFIECCVVVKGLTEKFRAKEDSYCGTASFTYDEFLLSVLPFIVA